MIEIIPAIDLIGGKCVRLKQGDYGNLKQYSEEPVQMAKDFESAGVQYLHLVDLDGARDFRLQNYRVLEKIASGTGLSIDFGGGVRNEIDVRRILDAGAERVNIGSLAVKNQPLFREILENYGPKRIVLAADSRKGRVQINGWKEDGGMDLMKLLEDYLKAGGYYAAVTDIDKDGMLEGVSAVFYRSLVKSFTDLRIIASGGVASFDDIKALESSGVFGVIAGKAIYERRITLDQISNYLKT